MNKVMNEKTNDAIDITMEQIIQELDSKNLLHLNSSKIKEMKNNILQKLYVSREELLKYHKVLSKYRYVDELDEIKIGSYIRWFNLKHIENLKLTNGGILIDVKPGIDDVNLICKNNRNMIFTLNMNKSIIFQKINYQEELLIKIVDYIQK
jgi:hypothetical protein|tara:strand:- start:216 stop:668 length:453 start_codon:yes stop_codon:yes gene_type:complete